jgi:hypothetical protein
MNYNCCYDRKDSLDPTRSESITDRLCICISLAVTSKKDYLDHLTNLINDFYILTIYDRSFHVLFFITLSSIHLCSVLQSFLYLSPFIDYFEHFQRLKEFRHVSICILGFQFSYQIHYISFCIFHNIQHALLEIIHVDLHLSSSLYLYLVVVLLFDLSFALLNNCSHLYRSSNLNII